MLGGQLADTDEVPISEPPPSFDAHGIIEWAASALGTTVAQLWELAKRLGDDETDRFAADMREVMHHGIDLLIRPGADPEALRVFQGEITAVLDAWVISARLAGSAEWHRQVSESTTALHAGDLAYFGEPLRAEDLHRRSA